MLTRVSSTEFVCDDLRDSVARRFFLIGRYITLIVEAVQLVPAPRGTIGYAKAAQNLVAGRFRLNNSSIERMISFYQTDAKL